MPPKIDPNLCNNCNICVDVCPTDLFREGEKTPLVAYPDECWYCQVCVYDCPKGAIKIVVPLQYQLRVKQVKKT